MRVLVTGSRDWSDRRMVFARLDALYGEASGRGEQEFVVVHGACPTGADQHAHLWVLVMVDRPDAVPCVVEEAHPAQWRVHTSSCPRSHQGNSVCKAAGFRRNRVMVEEGADWCLAFIKDHSNGASHTLDIAERAHINCHVDRINTLERSKP